MDYDQIPDILNTPEMRQALKVVERFSENEEDYLRYQHRLDAERMELTWKAMLEQKIIELEHERQEKERERQEKERLLALLRKAGIDPQQP